MKLPFTATTRTRLALLFGALILVEFVGWITRYFLFTVGAPLVGLAAIAAYEIVSAEW